LGKLKFVLLGTWLFFGEQLKPFFILGIFFIHFFCNEKIIREKVRTQDLWAIKGILTTTLIFSFENNILKKNSTIPQGRIKKI
jgi:hypothetical protein